MKFLALSSPQVANVSTRFASAPQSARRAHFASRHFLLSLGAAFCLTSLVAPSQAAPRKRTTAKSASKARVSKTKAPAPKVAPAKPRAIKAPLPSKALPQYLPLDQINMLRAARANLGWGALQPLMNGRKMDDNMQQLPGAAPMIPGLPPLSAGQQSKVQSVAQQFPIAPASVRPAAPIVPKWVRYPLEFQLAGIGIGSRAVDKDQFNRIDRYGLFAMHGNPTAVVVPGIVAADAAGGGEGGSGSSSGGSGGGSAYPAGRGDSSGEGGGSTTTASATQNITLLQTPPEVSSLFPGSTDGALPDWAAAITVQLDNNHVEWLYNRDTYSMGFVVDRLGFVDAIVVAGTQSPITRTQLEDPVHTIKLGDDLRKVMFRYGYPDTIESYTVALAGVGTAAPAGAGGEGGGSGSGSGSSGSSSGSSGEGGGEGSGGAEQAGNNAYRTFELRYEQSYNVVFTIRDNRVVRIYIFGDPDFFTERRRRQFRIAY